MQFRSALLAAGFLLAAPFVQANTLPSGADQSFMQVVQTTAQRTTTDATYLIGAGMPFLIGALQLHLAEGESATLTYTFKGADTDVLNRFFGPGGSSMIDSRAPFRTSLTTVVTGGLLDFGFQSGIDGTLVNNRNNNASLAANIGMLVDETGRRGWLIFSEGGPNSNHDYDDMLMRFDLNVGVSPVPEAGTTVLMFAGLGVLAVAARRRKRGAVIPAL